MYQISHQSIRNNIHNHSCHDNPTKNCQRGLLNINFQKRGDQRTCPCPCSRKRDSHKQHQSPELIFLYLITLFHCPVFHFYNKPPKKFRFFQNPENLSDKQKDKRNRNNITDNTQWNCFRSRYFKQRSRKQSSPEFQQRNH